MRGMLSCTDIGVGHHGERLDLAGKSMPRNRRLLRLTAAAFLFMAFVSVTGANGAEEPDLIFRRSTVFKWLTPNDKLATYGLDDPEVDGVACHFTVPERGGLSRGGSVLPKRYRTSHFRAVR